MVELFDAYGVSFVAVTQQFNTTTSMGRLTLNVSLSFAQFEREVTGERIRDKHHFESKKHCGKMRGLLCDGKRRRCVIRVSERVLVKHAPDGIWARHRTRLSAHARGVSVRA